MDGVRCTWDTEMRDPIVMATNAVAGKAAIVRDL